MQATIVEEDLPVWGENIGHELPPAEIHRHAIATQHRRDGENVVGNTGHELSLIRAATDLRPGAYLRRMGASRESVEFGHDLFDPAPRRNWARNADFGVPLGLVPTGAVAAEAVVS
jgi:hypothetical protein